MHRFDAPTIREISVADKDAGPYGIAAGPDGALWFTLNQADAIGRITVRGDVLEHRGVHVHGVE
ncbi:hypothetical protein GCM10010421_46840 [Streptomyces glaucus]|uniref:Virginiamycin B lyase n=1 Tax=Streptomyces glaucus TaxID=284029 RepID=A0ABN3K7V2_9ACTN